MNTRQFLPLLALVAALQVHAGPGHDHGDEAPSNAGVALPRFAAISDAFELVGVLDGKTLTLYLDRAASNEPVPQASIELELAGAKLSPKTQTDGSFVVTLAQAPGDGSHAVTATVTVGEETDLLAGELDLHLDYGKADEHAPVGWKRWGIALMGGGLGLAALAAFLRRKRSTSFGAAA
ncbi:MAG: hypothetical protein ACK520_13090 [Inhella sp.]